MKLKSFLITAALGVSLTAHAQNTAKNAVTSNIVDQGTRGITAEKTKNTLNSIIDWVGTPSLRRLTIVQLRALNTDWPSAVHVTDANGVFTLDVADLATSDDGVNTLVTTSGAKRYKRVVGTIAAVNGLQTALDTKANAANARLTGQVGVNVTVPGYDVDVAGGIRAANGGVMGSGTMNPNAILDLQSTTKVFYPPRMTQVQRLAIASGSPGAAALAYQSDGTPGLYVFDTSWKRLFTASDALPAAQITGLTKSSVGLANVDNTADALKPVSSAQQAALDLKLSLTGGNLTGVLGMTNESGLQIYNSSTITADYDRGNIGWQNNVFTIDATRGGSGTLRPVGLKSIANTFNVNPGPSLTGRIFDINAISSVGSGQGIIASTGNISNSAGNTYNTALFSTVNQSGSAGHSELYISPYFQATGGSPRYLIRAGTNTAAGGSGTHTDVFTVSQIGATYMAGSLTVDGIDGVYSDKGVRAWGTAGKYAIRTANDVQSRYSSYDLKLNASADNDYNASYILQHYHKYDMFAPANTYTVFRAFQNKIMIGANTLPTEVLSVSGNTSVSGNVISNGNLNVGEGTDATAKAITVGNARTANGTAGINFIGDTGGNSGLSIQRQGSAGVNSVSELIHRGTGQFRIHAYEAADIDFATNSTSRMSISAAGVVNVANKMTIGTASSNAPLQFASALANRKIVLSELANNDHEFYGLGVNTSIMRYQVSNTSAAHVFYAGSSTTTSNELLRINNTGIGIKGASVNGELQFPQTTTNKKLVLFENVANDHEYYGFGINTSILRYQASNVNASHVFYAATSSTTSNELLRINNTGVTMKGVQTFVASDGSMSNTIEGGYTMNGGGARTLLINNSSSIGTEGTLFRNSNTNTNIMAVLNRGNVGIGTTLPHVSTILDLKSTTAGLGLPSLTTAQVNAIATPQAGLTVYNTTLSKLCYYNGIAWKQVTDSNM